MQTAGETITHTPNTPGPLRVMSKVRQIAIITTDLYRTIDQLRRAGLGPWKVYRFDGDSVKDRTYMGQPSDYAYKIALAEMPGMAWELIQPISGKTIYSDFLDRHGEGFHHVLVENEDMSRLEKETAFTQAGYSCVMSGKWIGLCLFAFYQASPTDGLIYEIVHKDEGWQRPDPDEVFDL